MYTLLNKPHTLAAHIHKTYLLLGPSMVIKIFLLRYIKVNCVISRDVVWLLKLKPKYFLVSQWNTQCYNTLWNACIDSLKLLSPRLRKKHLGITAGILSNSLLSLRLWGSGEQPFGAKNAERALLQILSDSFLLLWQAIKRNSGMKP